MKLERRGMRYTLAAATLSALLLAGGCVGLEIKHSQSVNAGFAGLKHYAWRTPSPLAAARADVQGALVDENVRALTDRELDRKGYVQSAEKPDFLMAITYRDEMDDPYSHRIQSLGLNAYRVKEKDLIWRGTAVGPIAVDAASEELALAVQGVLEGLPAYTAAVPADVRLTELGFRSLQQGDYAKAEQYLGQALSENPNNPYALLNLGAVYQNSGRPGKARETYEKLVRLNPPEVAAVSTRSGAEGTRLVDIAIENLRKLQ